MKKILLSAIMLTALSFASFADEVKENAPKKADSNETSTKSTYEVAAYCGMTSCGVPYCFTGSGEMRENSEMAIRLWDLADAFYCQS